MKKLIIELCQIVNWQQVINAVLCICWGILALIALYLLVKHVVQPLISNGHQRKSKEKAFEQEKFWAFFKRIEEPVHKELSETKRKLDDLISREQELKQRESDLEKAEIEYNIKILEAKVKAYEEIMKKTK